MFNSRHLRVWSWQSRTPTVAGDWQARAVVTRDLYRIAAQLTLANAEKAKKATAAAEAVISIA